MLFATRCPSSLFHALLVCELFICACVLFVCVCVHFCHSSKIHKMRFVVAPACCCLLLWHLLLFLFQFCLFFFCVCVYFCYVLKASRVFHSWFRSLPHFEFILIKHMNFSSVGFAACPRHAPTARPTLRGTRYFCFACKC